jgi:hypothetical protein
VHERDEKYNIFVGQREGKIPLGRSKRMWEDNNKTDLREIGFESVNWIHLAQDRDRWRALVKTVKNLKVPKKGWKFLLVS